MRTASEASAQAVTSRVDAFVRRHFRLRGTVRLHSAALGWDILRAPVNVALAPVFLIVGLTGLLASLIGLRRLGAWLSSRQILFPTSVSRRVEVLIAEELLEDTPLTDASRKLLSDYTAVRSAVSEITTSLIVFSVGLVLFGTPTPGIASLAPSVSGYMVHSSAVANFPLGAWAGERYYDVFPIHVPVQIVVITALTLAMIASVVTTFAGIVADPVQTALGIHRRRLIRLLHRIATLEGRSSGLAPEHILARLADLTDAGIGLVRIFRS